MAELLHEVLEQYVTTAAELVGHENRCQLVEVVQREVERPGEMLGLKVAARESFENDDSLGGDRLGEFGPGDGSGHGGSSGQGP